MVVTNHLLTGMTLQVCISGSLAAELLTFDFQLCSMRIKSARRNGITSHASGVVPQVSLSLHDPRLLMFGRPVVMVNGV